MDYSIFYCHHQQRYLLHAGPDLGSCVMISVSFIRTIPCICQTQLSTVKLRDHNANKSFITLKKICS